MQADGVSVLYCMMRQYTNITPYYYYYYNYYCYYYNYYYYYYISTNVFLQYLSSVVLQCELAFTCNKKC